jgi:putative hydrolase of the HAD superfamily
MQGIFFDLDNTLIDRAAALEGYLRDLARRFPGVLPDEAALQALRELDLDGYCDRADFCRSVVGRFPGLGMSPAAFWADFSDGLARAVTVRPEVVNLVKRLGDRYRLAVVSNGGSRRQRDKLRRAGLGSLLTEVVISEEVDAEKPDPGIFAAALDRVGLAASEVLFVGDDPVRDIAGADAVGLVTCWVSHGRAFPGDLPRPALTIESVEELEQALAGAVGEDAAT